jgi:hypothetical protein
VVPVSSKLRALETATRITEQVNRSLATRAARVAQQVSHVTSP